jgi:hypothetical protein
MRTVSPMAVTTVPATTQQKQPNQSSTPSAFVRLAAPAGHQSFPMSTSNNVNQATAATATTNSNTTTTTAPKTMVIPQQVNQLSSQIQENNNDIELINLHANAQQQTPSRIPSFMPNQSNQVSLMTPPTTTSNNSNSNSNSNSSNSNSNSNSISIPATMTRPASMPTTPPPSSRAAQVHRLAAINPALSRQHQQPPVLIIDDDDNDLMDTSSAPASPNLRRETPASGNSNVATCRE